MENSDKIAEIEKISNEIERCMNLFPQKDYLHKSYSSKGFDNDGMICLSTDLYFKLFISFLNGMLDSLILEPFIKKN